MLIAHCTAREDEEAKTSARAADALELRFTGDHATLGMCILACMRTPPCSTGVQFADS